VLGVTFAMYFFDRREARVPARHASPYCRMSSREYLKKVGWRPPGVLVGKH
jgi:hypothetical protein